MKFFWESTEARDFDSLLHAIPDAVLQSPRRSVVPLVDFFRVPVQALVSLQEAIDAEISGSAELWFEYAVPVQRGRGKPSYTDLMVLAPGVSIGIEAKFTEPRYETVRGWLGTPRKANREDVLQGWISLLDRVGGSEIAVEHLLDLPYQLIHRTASACAPSAAEKHLVYMVFGSDNCEHYVKDVSAMATRLGQQAELAMHVLNIPLKGTATFDSLMATWDSGDRALADAVRAALAESPLFSFGPPRTLRGSIAIPGSA